MASISMVLLATALINLFTKSVATISGISFSRRILRDLYRLRIRQSKKACALANST